MLRVQSPFKHVLHVIDIVIWSQLAGQFAKRFNHERQRLDEDRHAAEKRGEAQPIAYPPLSWHYLGKAV